MNYWEECIRIGLEEAEINATDAQVGILTDSVQSGYENYSVVHGYAVIGNPVDTRAQAELRELKRQNEAKEKWVMSTKPCIECLTTGVVQDGWGRDVICFSCNGKGRS